MLNKTHLRVWALLVMLLALNYNCLVAQSPYIYNQPQLQAAEYFWDTDPGYGNGYQFTATDGNFDEAVERVLRNNAPMPAVGVHTFNMRVKDGKGNWGALFKKAFQVEDSAKIANAVMLTTAEYFWDTDPGYGSGTALLAFDGNFNEALEQAYRNTTSLPAAGVHLFNIRVRDSKNNWGPLFKKAVQLGDVVTTPRLLTVKAAEYFWDTDPGYGSANTLLAFDGNFNEALENVFTNSAQLPAAGLHLFNIRIKSENNTWGPLFKKAVQLGDVLTTPRLLTVKAAEYFWDTDPGYGSASVLLAFDGNFNEALENVLTNNATLPTHGTHLFNIRVKSENNTWGPLFKKAVQVTDVVNNPRLLSVTAAECFWGNTDPGYDNGTALLAFDGNFNEALEQVNKTLTSFTEGIYLFNIRARDERNNWGPLFKKAVQIDAQPRQLLVTQAEYFWDTDPGYGNGYQLLAIDGNFNEALESAYNNNATTTIDGLHLFNVRVKDEKGRWGPLFKKAVMIIADFTELNVTVNHDTATVCNGDSVFLQAYGAGSFTWSPATGLNRTTGAGVFAKPTVNTTYMVIGQGEPGEYDTAYVTVKVVPNTITVNLGNDTSICYPATVTLNAGTATSYNWSTGATTQTISVNATGNYIVTVTNAAGCSKRDTLRVTVDTINNATILPLTVAVCNGQSTTLSATGGNSYVWSNSLGTSPNVTVSPVSTTTYTVTITKGACVTNVSRLVTVNQATTGTINASICQGQTYLFNGVNRTTTGAYLDTLVNANGCDSILTLNLTVKSTTSGTINASICQGQAYLFNGVNRTTTGTYLDTLVNANGCDSILTLNLTVKPTTTGIINASICPGQSYFFNGANRTTAGAYLDTLVNANGCDSILTLNLTIKPTTTGTINASICPGQAYFFNGVNRTTAGTYLDTLVNANGCDSILTLNLTLKQTTTGTINASICQGQSYLFNGVNRTTTGAYRDTLVGSNGCDSILTLNLTVNAALTSSFNASICQGQSYFYNGVNRTTSGAYLDTLTASGGCDSIVTLNLTVKQNTSGSVSVSICQGQSYLFNGINRTTSGAYLDTLVNANGCDSILTLNLTVKPTTTGSINASICQGQSYLFNGINRTTAGTYLDTLVNANGCDSILTLNLTVKPTTTGSINASICQGQAYLFNGVNRTTTGTYLDTLVNANGCDSILTLNLTVKPTTTGSINASICQGQSYFFNGANRTATGAYLDTLVNAAGCDSILTLNLTVKQPTYGVLNVGLCQGQSYLFNGVNRTTTGTYLDTLVNVAGCDSFVTLNLTVSSAVTSAFNVNICQGQSYFYNGVNRTTTGTYLDTLTANGGCDSIVTLNLTVNQPTAGSVNATICQGQVYLFNGANISATGSYRDTLVNATGCDSILTLNLQVNPTAAGNLSVSICQGQTYFYNGVNLSATGTYLDTLVSANGCDSILTLNLTVKPNSTGSISASICQGQSYFFNGINRIATGVYTDTLINANGCDSILTLNLTVTPVSTGAISAAICQGQSYLFNGVNITSSGTYMDTLVNANGCDSVLTLTLTVNPVTNGTLNVGICQGQTYLFNGVSLSTSGIYLDTLTNTTGCDSILTLNLTVSTSINTSFNQSICQGQSYLYNGVNLTAPGVYLDTLTAIGGCDSIVALHLTVNTPTTGAINATICSGQSYLFNGINQTASGLYTDTLVNAAGCDSIVTLNLSVNAASGSAYSQTICNGSSYLFNGQQLTQAGVYYDTLQAANSCDSIITLTLSVNPAITSSYADTICQGDSYLFNGANLTLAGEYYDTLQAANGCDSVVTLHLSLHSLPLPVISRTGDTLTTQVYVSYQWLKNSTAISGATTQTLVLTQTGNYSVIVTDGNGCSDTSAVQNVLSVGLGHVAIDYSVKLYPNPNTGNFVIEFADDVQREIEITDAIGRLIVADEISRRKEYMLDKVAAGIYFLNIKHNGAISSIKFSVVK